uniref:Actin n=1 Tax=Chromera velia CCMP2878 TaxID=1169474 RepID=A0A0G4HR94_9ALVE
MRISTYPVLSLALVVLQALGVREMNAGSLEVDSVGKPVGIFKGSQATGDGEELLIGDGDGETLLSSSRLHQQEEKKRGGAFSGRMQNIKCVVIDFTDGGLFGLASAGLSGSSGPSFVFPSIVGRGADGKTVVVGKEAEMQRTKDPEEDEIIPIFPEGKFLPTGDSESNLETALPFVFKHLEVHPEEHPLVLPVPFDTDAETRRALHEVAVNSVHLQRMMVMDEAVAVLISTGRTTGIIFSLKEDHSLIVPVFEGVPIPEASRRLHIGQAGTCMLLVKELTPQLEKAGLKGSFEIYKTVQDIREKLAYVAENYEEELKKGGETKVEYTLPNGGQVITVGAERFRSPEVLFKPSLIGLEQDGIHKLTYESILKCDVDIRRDLYRNVVMSGGTTMVSPWTPERYVGCGFKNIEERMAGEMVKLGPADPHFAVKIVSPILDKGLEGYSPVWQGSAVASAVSVVIADKGGMKEAPSLFSEEIFLGKEKGELSDTILQHAQKTLAENLKGSLRPLKPVVEASHEKGIVTSWDDMIKSWDDMERVAPEEHS